MSSREVLPELREDRGNEDPADREESLGREKPEVSLIVYSILWEVKAMMKKLLNNSKNFRFQTIPQTFHSHDKGELTPRKSCPAMP